MFNLISSCFKELGEIGRSAIRSHPLCIPTEERYCTLNLPLLFLHECSCTGETDLDYNKDDDGSESDCGDGSESDCGDGNDKM